MTRLVVMLGTVGLSVATVAALAARQSWLLDLFSHFRLQYLVVALLLLPLALLVRSWPVALVLILVAAIHGWALRGLWPTAGEAAVAGGVPLRVVSANVLARNETPREVFRFASAAEADVVVLVDAEGERWKETLAAFGEAYPHQAPKGWRDGAPVILFSRFPIQRQELVEPVGGHRPYLLAEVAIGAGVPTLVAAVHPTSPKPADPGGSWVRNAQLDYIAESVDHVDGPVIVAGDLNTTPFSPHFADLVRAADLRSAAAGEGYVGTWPDEWWPLRIPIDNVLVKGPIAVRSFGRGGDVGSDHFPIVADLALLEPDPAARD